MSRGIRDFGIIGPTDPKGPTHCPYCHKPYKPFVSTGTEPAQAEQFDGPEKMIKKYDIEKHEMDGGAWFDLYTVEGAMEIVKGDWIVSCESGTWFIPDKIFRQTYEEEE